MTGLAEAYLCRASQSSGQARTTPALSWLGQFRAGPKIRAVGRPTGLGPDRKLYQLVPRVVFFLQSPELFLGIECDRLKGLSVFMGQIILLIIT